MGPPASEGSMWVGPITPQKPVPSVHQIHLTTHKSQNLTLAGSSYNHTTHASMESIQIIHMITM